MELIDFETIFHLAVIFNFAFTFKKFSEHIKGFFSSPLPAFTSFIIVRVARNLQMLTEDYNNVEEKETKTIVNKLSAMYISFTEKIETVRKNNEDFDFNDKFECAYLVGECNLKCVKFT